jgi:hypothetical protein
VDWIGLAQDRETRGALVNATMNLPVPQNAGKLEWLHNWWPVEWRSDPQN